MTYHDKIYVVSNSSDFNNCTFYILKMCSGDKIPFSYMLYAYSVKEPIWELNLKRALDEDTGVFSSFFNPLLHWVRQPFLGIPPFISDPVSLCLFFILIFCESFMYIFLILQDSPLSNGLVPLANIGCLGTCIYLKFQNKKANFCL